MSTILGDMARSSGRALVIRIIAALIVIPLACGLIFIPMWVFIRGSLSPWVLILPAAMFLLLLFGGSAIYMLVMLNGRKKMLDKAFVPLGLQGKAYLTYFRQYHGAMSGRRIEVYLARGPRLEIEASTSIQTRMGVTGPHADTRFFAELANRPPIAMDDPELSELMVFPHDEAWTRRLFHEPIAASIINRLVTPVGTFTRQQVILRPGTFKLLLSGNTSLLNFNLEPDVAHRLVSDMVDLVDIAENLPPPTFTDELSSLEQSAYRSRQGNPYLAAWVGVGMLVFFLLLTVCVAGLVYLLATLD